MSKFWLLKTLRKINFLKNKRIDFELEVNGKNFVVPLISEIGLDNHRIKELWMLDLFKRIKPTDTDVLIDVGAHTGQTLLKWKSVNEEAHYYGFEPMTKCIEYLEDLIEINQFKNSTLVNKALYDKEGKQTLFFHKKDDSDRTASLVKTHRKERDSEIVETTTFAKFLDNQILSAKSIKAIKIDVEGAELEVLNELSQLLIDNKPIVIIEILAYSPKVDKDRLKQTSEFIKTLPYDFYRITKKDNRFDGLKAIDEVVYPVPRKQSDYLLVPKGHEL